MLEGGDTLGYGYAPVLLLGFSQPFKMLHSPGSVVGKFNNPEKQVLEKMEKDIEKDQKASQELDAEARV